LCFYRWGDFRGRGLSYIRGELQISEETACKLATAIAFVIARQVFEVLRQNEEERAHLKQPRRPAHLLDEKPGHKAGKLCFGVGAAGTAYMP
jgi:hypothetical protein